MKNSNFILFLSVLVQLLVIQISNAELYEYMQFVLQYPHGLCYGTTKGKCISPLPTKFTVHDIWSSNFSGIYIYCNNALTSNPFDTAQITPQQTDMGNSWPSVLTQNNNLQFWQHEYDNHGACAVESGVPPFTQKSYFERGNQLWNKYDIHSVLDQSGIKAGPAASYIMTQIVAAIQKKIGSGNTPVLRCKELKLQSRYVLTEVIICLDHQATNVINCPSTRTTNCQDPSGKVYYVA